MGYDYKFADHQNLADKTDTQNIIYPILDVLDKASKKLEQTPQIDYVIVNGGMSKFCLIINRLTEFFGKEPIRLQLKTNS